MGRVVAIGGGGSDAMLRYIVNMVKKDEKHLLFVGTPSGDSEEKEEYWKNYFNSIGCISDSITLIKKKYTSAEIDAILDWADIIYVCGGDTNLMIRVWKETGFDKKLIELYNKDGAILCGSSAGGMCWFERGYSDCSPCRKPDHSCGWIDGIGIYKGVAFCPHCRSRLGGFEEEIAETDLVGYEVDDEAAIVDDNGKISFIRSEDELFVCKVTNTDKGLKKEYQDVKTV